MTPIEHDRAKCLGIDIGGSSIKIGLITTGGELLSKTKISSEALASHAGFLQTLEDFICQSQLAKKDIAHIGVAMPCTVDNGIPSRAVNLSVDLAASASSLRLSFPHTNLHIINDANAAALGEGWVGAARFSQSYAFVTLGTGVGCGIVINGALFRGTHGAAGEIGHICIDSHGRPCSCGSKGCLEQYVSTQGLVTSYIAAGGLLENGRIYESSSIFEKHREGDPSAATAIEEFGKTLGIGLAAVARVIDLETIYIGGGISNYFNLFDHAMQQSYQEHTPRHLHTANLKPSLLGNDAGMLGAVRYALSKQEKESLL